MPKDKLFSFNTPEFSNYNLEVVSFKGYQEMGELFRYEIDLISKEKDIDFDKMLNTEVSLQLHNKNSDDIYIYGVLEYFEAHQMIDDFIHYKAALVPKLWWLTLAQHQQIFLDKKVPDIIESVLKDARFTSNDYEFRLQGKYDKREYVCQYKESRYDFIKRWMHRDGIYFYFESDENGCKVIITDIKDTQKHISNMDKMIYKPVSGLQDYEQQAVSSIVYRSNNTLKSVRMRNYNYEKPSLDINSSTDSAAEQYTQTYLFGNNIKSQDEAKKLSEINAQKYKCLDKEMSGESNITSLVVGNIYTLKDYFKQDLNGDYLMVRVECEGSQRGFFTTAFNKDGDNSTYYRNTFLMIPSSVQYRMQTTPQWPHIGGMISAVIDGQGSGDTAELDKHGRYKVVMPFDLSGRKDAKASAYLRMAQPSAGEKQGIHFPLHKGTEVLIAFKGGDPDQPIITGAVPNINTPSPVNEDNVTKNIIQTHGGNIIHMEDTPGKAHIKMAVHDDLSSITIHNEDDDPEAEWGVAVKTVNGCQFVSAEFSNTVLGNKEESILGATENIQLGESFELFGGIKQEVGLTDITDYITGNKRGIEPISDNLGEEVGKVIVEKELVVVNKTENITQNVTKVVREEVDIKTKAVQEWIQGIVTNMKLTENCVTKTELNETKKILSDNLIKAIKAEEANIDNLVKKIKSSFKSLEVEITKVESIVSNAKFIKDAGEFRQTLFDMSEITNKLTIFN